MTYVWWHTSLYSHKSHILLMFSMHHSFHVIILISKYKQYLFWQVGHNSYLGVGDLDCLALFSRMTSVIAVSLTYKQHQQRKCISEAPNGSASSAHLQPSGLFGTTHQDHWGLPEVWLGTQLTTQRFWSFLPNKRQAHQLGLVCYLLLF